MWVGEFGPYHIREVRPSDFVFAQILRDKEENLVSLVLRMCINKDAVLAAPAEVFRELLKWIADTLLYENILTAENWMEISFHLNKQRWDDGIDWLEKQPMSKIKAMIQINEKMAEDQEDRMKKASRR